MSKQVEIPLMIEFYFYGTNWDYIQSNIISAVRQELARVYASGEISKPEVTIKLWP